MALTIRSIDFSTTFKTLPAGILAKRPSQAGALAAAIVTATGSICTHGVTMFRVHMNLRTAKVSRPQPHKHLLT